MSGIPTTPFRLSTSPNITLIMALALMYIVQTLHPTCPWAGDPSTSPFILESNLPVHLMSHRNSGVSSDGSASSLALLDPTATTVTLLSGSTVCSR